jgi:hypothetical protein
MHRAPYAYRRRQVKYGVNLLHSWGQCVWLTDVTAEDLGVKKLGLCRILSGQYEGAHRVPGFL